jgi:gamma-glutamyltranspeptidase / glutathione hydrolase
MVRTYKQGVVASRAVVAANHPLASLAGAEMLALGGNAVDAAVATLFALSVVEPMMVSPFGAGYFVIRDGRSGDVVTIDNYATVPLAATPDMYDAVPDNLDYETVGKTNDIGYLAVATPGALKGWAHAVRHYGRLPWGRHIEPAIRHAASGFPASDYLIQIIEMSKDALERFPASAEVFLPGGRIPTPGQLIVRSDYARTLRQIAEEGAETLYTGALGRAVAEDMAANGGLITMDDLASYRVVERAPVRGDYRGHAIISMAPTSRRSSICWKPSRSGAANSPSANPAITTSSPRR